MQPGERLVGEVGTQVIGLVVRRLDRNGVLEQARLILRGLAGEKAVEIVEAVAGRPTVERPHRRRFGRRRVVPLAEGRGLVAVVVQHLGDRRRALRDDAGIAVEVERALRDRAGADALVIAPGQQRGPRRRADRGRVELIEGDALVGEPRQGRRVDLAAKRVGQAKADIVQEDDENVRRVGRKMVRLSAPDMLEFLQRRPGGARGRHRRERQNRSESALELLRQLRSSRARDERHQMPRRRR